MAFQGETGVIWKSVPETMIRMLGGYPNGQDQEDLDEKYIDNSDPGDDGAAMLNDDMLLRQLADKCSTVILS